MIIMNIKKIKKLVEKGIKWSGEKQVQIFMSSGKTQEFFKEAMRISHK